MPILVLADHDGQQFNAQNGCAVAAALEIAGDVDVLVAGHGVDAVAEQAKSLTGVRKVLVADAEHFDKSLAEEIVPQLVAVAKNGGYSHVLAPATSIGKDCIGRAAALLGTTAITDILSVEASDTFTRPIYAGNCIAKVQTKADLVVGTVRSTAFDAVETSGDAAVEAVEVTEKVGISSFVRDDIVESSRPDLTAAEVVISGGRGLGSKEDFALLDGIADKLGAAIGASRAAVDSGYAPNDLQVGQTGKVVAPQLYIAVGISGAIQHLAGMKDSKVIVAINKDPDAPIFQVADYGLVGDLFTVVPELEEKV